MRRSKKMFTKLTSMLHTAVEAFAPEMSLLEQLRYHWKCVTQFFLDTADEKIAVENTTIPEHLEQMIEVLKIEEQENGTGSAGPSMEFMLQHKILETMQTLGKADCPPGMKRYVLIFFTKLLGKLKQQLLPHMNVHKPVNKLIRCCGSVKAAPTETEEVHFLLQVSSKLKQDSYLVNFFLEKPASTESGSSPPLSPGGINDREKPEYSLVDALLTLMKSEDSRVAIKACEGLLLVTSILEDNAASTIVLYTAFCEKMADQLSKLFKGLPQVLDPADINQSSATWGFDHDDQLGNDFVGKRQLTAFLSWLDYVNQLSVEAHPMVSKALAQAIQERFILTAIEPGLSQASEPCAITVTAILTRCLKLVSSPTLAQEFANILLGNDMEPELPGHESPHKLRRLLIQRVNHLSDQLSVETLRLFQALLQLSYQPILDTLIVRNFQKRTYLDWNKVRKSKMPISRTASIASKNSLNINSTSTMNSNKTVEVAEVKDTDTKSDQKSSIDSEDRSTEINENIGEPGENTALQNEPITAEPLLEEPTNALDNSSTVENSIENAGTTVDSNKEVKCDENNEDMTVGADNSKNNIESGSVANIELNEGTADNSQIEPAETELEDDINNPKQTSDQKQVEVAEEVDELDDDDLDGCVVTIEFNKSPPKQKKKSKNNGIEATKKQENSPAGTEESSPAEKVEVSFADSPVQVEDVVRNGFIKKKIEKAVNGFLLILPDHLKTSESSGETGYDSYLREAHKQCKQRSIQELSYNWPSMMCLQEEEEDTESVTSDFYEGAFLNTIFKRLERMLEQSYDINLEVTGILALLCQFRHPYLHEFLIDTSGLVKDSVFTLHRILLKVCQDIANRGMQSQQALAAVRKNLHDPTQHVVGIPDETCLQGIVVLEEFCKELAAIAFVSATMDINDD